MLVKELMTTAPFGVTPRTSVWEATGLMLARKVSGLPVRDENGALVGVLSEDDLLRRAELGTTRHEGGWFHGAFHPGGIAEAHKRAHARTVADVMTADPVTIASSAPLGQAVTLMEKHRVKRLPVVAEGRLIGILSRADFLRASPLCWPPPTRNRRRTTSRSSGRSGRSFSIRAGRKTRPFRSRHGKATSP